MEQERGYLDDEDGPWYMGKAREEFRRRKGSPSQETREDEDPIQVHHLIATRSGILLTDRIT